MHVNISQPLSRFSPPARIIHKLHFLHANCPFWCQTSSVRLLKVLAIIQSVFTLTQLHYSTVTGKPSWVAHEQELGAAGRPQSASPCPPDLYTASAGCRRLADPSRRRNTSQYNNLRQTCFTAITPLLTWHQIRKTPLLTECHHYQSSHPLLTFIYLHTYQHVNWVTQFHSVIFLHLYWNRTNGNKWQRFLQAGSNQETMSQNNEENTKHIIQPVTWPQSFIIHHWTLNDRAVATFMLALRS